ncbi:MAG: Gfo/Idh/MocA family oxidoreductase [Magnetococcales bacterium]|nr:Gfo/Idh/MocA family oxidoreductase [Magnetococcales bacterium]
MSGDSSIHATPDIAIIGAGYWGKNLVRNFHAAGALRMICDQNTEQLAMLTAQYSQGGVRGVQTVAEVLRDPDIKGVAIATPACTHADLVRESLLAGKDVFVEKPLCLSLSEGESLIRLARDRGCILMVGHLLWYHPVVLKLKQLIDAGEFGKLQYIYSLRLNLGKFRREENVLWSFAPHDISVILGLCQEMPESIIAQGGNFINQKIADTTITLFRFPSGVQAHIFVSWLHPIKEQKLVVVGDRKMAVFDDTAPWPNKLQIFPHTIQWTNHIPSAVKDPGEYVTVAQQEPLRAECDHFLECIRKRLTPRTDGAEGLRVLSVLNACQTAMGTQTPQRVAEPASPPAVDFFRHETAIIDDDVNIGSGSKIWHFSHILTGSRIGKGCNIGQNVTIGPRVQIGDGCKIQNNVSIYEGVMLGDEVFCGPSMVFTNVINPRANISRKHAFLSTRVDRGCTIGANATIVCGNRLGRWSFIGAGAVVTHDVPDFALMVGNPARRIGWMSRFGEKLDLPVSGHGSARCPHTGENYVLEGDRVTWVTDTGA